MAGACIEFAMGQLVGGGPDQRLIGRFPAAQAKETDLTYLKIHFRANQAVLPQRVYFPVMSE